MADLYVVGIGPGAYEKMTVEAVQALIDCTVIVGYSVYVDLVKPWLSEKTSENMPEKEFFSTPMRQEKERCKIALASAAGGKNTAMVCSGDSAVYGMAGLILELLLQYLEDSHSSVCAQTSTVNLKIIPGVTAALAGGAVLGAPLTHDFAVISLSDLLTPMETIKSRIQAAAFADFVICLYNPSSKKRRGYLKMACELILNFRRKDTICGIVSHIGREGQEMEILSLEELKDREVDMFATVFVGNSQTKKIGEYMVTPRGYLL